MAYIAETSRLRLREFDLSDGGFILKLVNSPGWLQFIGDRNIRTEEQAKAYIGSGPITSYRENGFGLWLVELKASRQAIGMCGILKRATLAHPDIGFAFLPEFTGNGYAFEMAAATLKFAREKLGLPVINAITVPNNERSINLLEKIGMCYKQTLAAADDGKELYLYST